MYIFIYHYFLYMHMCFILIQREANLDYVRLITGLVDSPKNLWQESDRMELVEEEDVLGLGY